jgi:dolichol-phosphate mannosyltransferase
MLELLDDPACDFVMATRYGSAGSIDADWPWLRKLVSRASALAARPLAAVSDPMSGFFAVRQDTWRRANKLDPIGYKIALELLVKARCRHIKEVPIQFGTRTAGHSKARLGIGLQYLRHLFKLYRFRYRWLLWSAAIVAILAAGIVYAALLRSAES